MRERLGFPLLKTAWTVGEQPRLLEGKPASRVLETCASSSARSGGGDVSEDLLFEIGAEELPAAFVEPARWTSSGRSCDRLEEARLAHGRRPDASAPRGGWRCWCEGVADRSRGRHARRCSARRPRRPSTRTGKPTRAATKFAESARGGRSTRSRRVQTPKGEYVGARGQEEGRPASEMLPGVLAPRCTASTSGSRMRWGDVEQTFARPVQWIVALCGAGGGPGRLRRREERADDARAPLPRARRHRADASPRTTRRRSRRRDVIADIAKRKARMLHGGASRRRRGRPAGGSCEDESLVDQVTEPGGAAQPGGGHLRGAAPRPSAPRCWCRR